MLIGSCVTAPAIFVMHAYTVLTCMAVRSVTAFPDGEIFRLNISVIADRSEIDAPAFRGANICRAR